MQLPPLPGLNRPPPPLPPLRPMGGGGGWRPLGRMGGMAAAGPPFQAKVPAPKVKLKTFFWDKLPDNAAPNTFWMEVEPAQYVEWEALEESFQQVVKARREKKEERPKAVNVLDLKKCTAIGIKIARLRLPWHEIPDAILRLDARAFTNVDDVQTVIDCIPTEDEMATLNNYLNSGGPAGAPGSLELLSDAEKFAIELGKTDRCKIRLETFKVRFTAMEKLTEAHKMLSTHLKAMRELQNSKTWKEALLVVLAVGNFLNHGTRQGNARGFRIKTLQRLADTRSQDGKMTVMQFVAKELCAKELPILAEEAPHMTSPHLKQSIEEAANVIQEVNDSIRRVEQQLEKAGPGVRLRVKVVGEAVKVDLVGDNFFDAMGSVLGTLQESHLELVELEGQAKEGFKVLLMHMGEVGTMTDTDFWAEVQLFVDQFSSAQRNILQERRDAEEREQRRVQREMRKEVQDSSRRNTADRQVTPPPHMRPAPEGRTPPAADASPLPRSSTDGTPAPIARPKALAESPVPADAAPPAGSSTAEVKKEQEEGQEEEGRGSGPVLVVGSLKLPLPSPRDQPSRPLSRGRSPSSRNPSDPGTPSGPRTRSRSRPRSRSRSRGRSDSPVPDDPAEIARLESIARLHEARSRRSSDTGSDIGLPPPPREVGFATTRPPLSLMTDLPPPSPSPRTPAPAKPPRAAADTASGLPGGRSPASTQRSVRVRATPGGSSVDEKIAAEVQRMLKRMVDEVDLYFLNGGT